MMARESPTVGLVDSLHIDARLTNFPDVVTPPRDWVVDRRAAFFPSLDKLLQSPPVASHESDRQSLRIAVF
nr:hypothetical protein REQ54_01763 [Rhizobium sp. Q54]